MSENLRILQKKLENLVRMQADVQHSISKMAGPLATIKQGDVSILTLDERETISAFTTRFATYQEQIGKSMKSVAIEDDANELHQILSRMVESAPWLFATHEHLVIFVKENYQS